MKSNALAFLWLVICLFSLYGAAAQNEPFTFSELNQRPASAANRYRLGHPFEIIYGPDDYLYITEKVGRILRVDTATGIRRVLLDIRSNVFLNITRNSSGAATGIGQDGMMGMALHPNFGRGTGQDSIFVAYTYSAGNVRISRFRFNPGANPTVNGETILINGIPASNDHSSGRLIIGADNKLYYSCGDLGANQFGNRCNPVRSQNDPTAAQISSANYTGYAGKILRLNMNGSIPADNPVFNGVRSHVFTKGHRNPQGLVWEMAASNGTGYPQPLVGGKLFSSEHGPRTDDEINILEPGMNYGWPFIAGDSDNVNYQYVNWSSSSACSSTAYTENTIPSGATITQESNAPASVKANFRKPMMSLYSSCGTQTSANCNAGGTDWMRFATIAPSGIDFYHVNNGLGIPGWYPSLLVPTLRKGTLYRLKLDPSRTTMVTDTIPYFTSLNRYRDIAISPDGRKIFIITDSIGTTSGPSGAGTNSLANRGAILVFDVSHALLRAPDNKPKVPKDVHVNVYPNPATDVLHVRLAREAHHPIQYMLYDMSGKLVLKGIAAKTSFNISLYGIRRGMYLLKVYDGYGAEQLSRKISVN